MLATTTLLLAPSVSFGQQPSGTTTNAYVVGRDGTPVVNPRSGECVRTRFWTPSASHPRCRSAATPAGAQGRSR
jgi:hypothetical protein